MTPLVAATRQLAVLARLGFPLGEGLRAMGDPSLQRVGDAMAEGDSMAQAVRRHPRAFSPFYASLVEAAEAAEKADGILTALSGWLERADSVRRRVRAALLYPALVLNVLLVEMLYFAVCVVPDVLLPMLDGAGWAIPRWVATPLPALVGIAAAAINAAILTDGQVFAGLAARLPWVGGLRCTAEQALWSRALATLLEAGRPLADALDAAAAVVLVPGLRRALAGCGEAVRRGGSLSAALAEAPDVDATLSWAAAAGEDREDVAPLLFDAADALDEQVRRRADHAARMAEPWALAAAGVLVLLGLLSFWWPFYAAIGSM